MSGQLSDLVQQIDYSQLVGVATGLLGRLTDAASTLVLLLTALVFVAIESSGFGRRMALVGAERPHLPVALTPVRPGHPQLSAGQHGLRRDRGDRRLDRAVDHRHARGRRCGGCWRSSPTTCPTSGSSSGVVPPALLGLLAGGWGELIAVVVVYSLLNFVVQTLIQPRFVGDSVGLSMTVTFIALLFWGWVLGALGALLAIPLTLLVKVLLVDVDPRGHWLDALLREEPRAPRTMRARRRMHARRAALASVRRSTCTSAHARRRHAPPIDPAGSPRPTTESTEPAPTLGAPTPVRRCSDRVR